MNRNLDFSQELPPTHRIPPVTGFYAAALIHLAVQRNAPLYLVARKAGETACSLRAAAQKHRPLPYRRVASAAAFLNISMAAILREAIAMRQS